MKTTCERPSRCGERGSASAELMQVCIASTRLDGAVQRYLINAGVSAQGQGLNRPEIGYSKMDSADAVRPRPNREGWRQNTRLPAVSMASAEPKTVTFSTLLMLCSDRTTLTVSRVFGVVCGIHHREDCQADPH